MKTGRTTPSPQKSDKYLIKQLIGLAAGTAGGKPFIFVLDIKYHAEKWKKRRIFV
jgi:hypothetical protein